MPKYKIKKQITSIFSQFINFISDRNFKKQNQYIFYLDCPTEPLLKDVTTPPVLHRKNSIWKNNMYEKMSNRNSFHYYENLAFHYSTNEEILDVVSFHIYESMDSLDEDNRIEDTIYSIPKIVNI